jgi:peptidoglycan/LPS O-acetylase OafA/YrhL
MSGMDSAPGATAAASPERSEKSAKIRDIERLRGVAILLVLMQHFSLGPTLFALLGLKPHRLPFGLGVELFFVISGYVVTQSFLHKGLSFRAFYLRRVFRLWPVLFIFFALTAAVNYAVHTSLPNRQTYAHADWGDLCRQAPLMLCGYYLIDQFCGATKVWYNAPMWSLSVEEQFYLTAPAVLALLWLVFRNHARACRWFTLGLYLFLAVGVRFGMAFGNQWGMPWLTRAPEFFKYLVFDNFDFLVLGVLLYFSRDLTAPLHRLPRPVRQTLMVLCLVGPLVAMYKMSNGMVNYAVFPHDAPWRHTVGLLGIGLAFSLAVVLASADTDLLAFPPVNRFLLYLGSRSYGIYVLHFPTFVIAWLPICLFADWLFYKPPICYGVVHCLMTIVVLVPMIELVYRRVEQPFIRLGARLVARLEWRKTTSPSGTVLAPERRMAA